MVIELTEKVVHLSIIGILMVLQIVQWYYIKKLKDSIQAIWGNIAIMALSMSYQVKQNESEQLEEQKSK